MRTRFIYAGLISIAGGLVGGCDDIHTGQPSDPSGPPKLVHVLVQETGAGGRAQAVDLIDNTPDVACSDTNPCVQQFNLGFASPDVACSASMPGQQGTCNDPLKVKNADLDGVPLFQPIGTPATGDPGGGTAIRVVFNKILDNGIETVTMDPTKAPGSTNTYVLSDTVIKLVTAADGKEVPSVKLLDNGGSPTFTSDLLLAPLGPALVLKPKAPLLPKTDYKIVLDAGAIKDRAGNVATDQNGAPLGSIPFTTEGVVLQNPVNALNGPATYPDFTAPAMIKPNEVIQLAFWTTVDATPTPPPQPAMGMPPGMSPPVIMVIAAPPGVVAARIEAYPDQGPVVSKGKPGPGSPAKCSQTGAFTGGTQVDLVLTSAPGMPVDWPAGDYDITVKITSDSTPATFMQELKFTVAGAKGDASDANIVDKHTLPEMCMNP